MLRRGPAGGAVAFDEGAVQDGGGLQPPPSPPQAETDAAQSPQKRSGFQTEFSFTLPRGYYDDDRVLHREGKMRLATARDELLPTLDSRVQQNPAYLTVTLLARVITQLGELDDSKVTTTVVENLFAADLAFLQDLYRRINSEGTSRAVVTCPNCNEQISVDLAGGRLGES
jgi:hypothetical protein